MSVLYDYRPVAETTSEHISKFVKNVYSHLFGAIAGFALLQTLMFTSGFSESYFNWLSANAFRWMGLFAGLMVANWFISSAAADISSQQKQYMGLAVSVVAQAVIMNPILYLAISVLDAGSLVWTAAAITAVSFALLTVIAMKTTRDLSFLRPIVMWGFGLALVAIIASFILPINLGIWFSVAMIGLSGAAILYQTQSAIRVYPHHAYVAASIALFGSVMTMFYYVLRLLLQLSRFFSD